QLHPGVQVGDRQFFVVYYALASDTHIRIHGLPALGTELLHGQDLACGLSGVAAPGLLLLVGVGTDQRGQIAEQQLIGYQAAGEARLGLAWHIGQVAMYGAVAYASVEIEIVIGGAILALQLSAALAVGGIGRRVRQGYSGERVEIAQAG